MTRTRPWLYAATGMVATAVVIGVIAYATGALRTDDAAGPGPAHSGPSRSPVTATTSATPGLHAYAVYYVGNDPTGKPVLYREFHRGAGFDDLTLALDDLSSPPADTDYRTSWPPGALTGSSFDGVGVIGQFGVRLTDPALIHRPPGMSAAEAEASVQQVVYTLQAAGRTTAPVQFYFGHQPAPTVLGVPTSEPLARGAALDTLSLMNISNPGEGDVVSGSLTVDGVNNGFEGSVLVYLERDGKRYLPTPTIGGYGPGRLFPWKVTLDLTKVPPGAYTLTAQNDDPTGHNRPDTDTKTVIVK